uniref:Integrase core domain containing protein n=1 Tax=Solanum tuberosum TaxID=4113 RepID=M1DJH0_SOLTU
MRKELVVLNNRMDGLKSHVQTQLLVSRSGNHEEFQSQLAEMRAQVAKLAEKAVQIPNPVMLESLMKIFDEQPTTQYLDDIWGELPKSKSDKRKHKAEESKEELHADLSKEERKQEKKARKASRKAEREKAVREQQQRDIVLAGASGSEVPTPVSDDQPTHVMSSESAPGGKGANADPETDA